MRPNLARARNPAYCEAFRVGVAEAAPVGRAGRQRVWPAADCFATAVLNAATTVADVVSIQHYGSVFVKKRL